MLHLREELEEAVQENDLDRAARAISAGANVNARNLFGCYMLHLAVVRSREMSDLLIAHGADMDSAVFDACLKPLHVVVERGPIEVAQLLIERGADLEAANAAGLTPADDAMANGRVAMLSLLIRAGAEPPSLDFAMKTLRSKDARVGHAECFAVLVEEGGIDARAAILRLRRCKGDIPRRTLTMVEALTLARVSTDTPGRGIAKHAAI